MGDVTLVSSDNVVFMVDSVYVFAARYVATLQYMWLNPSPVFRDAGSSARNVQKMIEFTDKEIEHSGVIRAFLELVVRERVDAAGSAPVEPDDASTCKLPSAYTVCRLAQFLLKWDCTAHLRLFTHWITMKMLISPAFSWCAFFIGALQDDDALCIRAVEAKGERKWRPKPQILDSYSCRSYGCVDDTMDPTAYPLWLWELLPTQYHWALVRAWNAEPGDRSTRGTVFSEFLTSAKVSFARLLSLNSQEGE